MPTSEAPRLNDALKAVYCHLKGATHPDGLDSCDDFKDWCKSTIATPVPASEAASHPTNDAIAKSKRILALVDTYHERPSAAARTNLRIGLMDEFAAPAAPTDKKENL